MPPSLSLNSSPSGPPSPDEERLLLARAKRGDRQAFAALAEPYRDRIYTTALRLTGNPDDASEITQDALMRTFWKLAGFHGQARFYTWLYRITLNLCYRRLDHRRREPLAQTSESSEQEADRSAESPQERLPDPSESPREVAESLERSRLIRRALSALPPRDFDILVLREFEGMSYDDLAQMLRIPKGTVMSRLHRARLALAAQLSKLGLNSLEAPHG